MIILVFIFGMLGALAIGYSDLRALHQFDARRNYDICVGASMRIERIVEKLTENSPPDRREPFLQTVRDTQNDCNVYKVSP